ncbi:hypothetical protein J6590_006458 [Homalodisca vitripennis]|nr:hypothetical protein J6590_006458 [Homalodisca vitripennis]
MTTGSFGIRNAAVFSGLHNDDNDVANDGIAAGPGCGAACAVSGGCHCRGPNEHRLTAHRTLLIHRWPLLLCLNYCRDCSLPVVSDTSTRTFSILWYIAVGVDCLIDIESCRREHSLTVASVCVHSHSAVTN